MKKIDLYYGLKLTKKESDMYRYLKDECNFNMHKLFMQLLEDKYTEEFNKRNQ